jgi:hypothetical protein
MKRVVFSWLALVAASWPARASAAEPAGKAYLLFPIRTELQRQFLFEPTERYYLLVHGDSLLDADGKVDPSRLNFRDLDDDIGRVRIVRPGDRIRALLVFAKSPPETADRLVNYAVLGWALHRRFERHTLSTTIGGRDWRAAVRLTRDARGLYEETEEEKVVGDETVRVYPVRTALSRLQTGSADCVVSFPQPYDKNTSGTVDEKTKARIKELVGSLRLKTVKSIEFAIRMKPDADQKAVDRFTDKTAGELKEMLGAKDYSVLRAHVP